MDISKCSYFGSANSGTWASLAPNSHGINIAISGHSIWERLDRGLATNSWFLKYPGTLVYHLPCLSSDHCPLLINPIGIEDPTSKKPFHFEEEAATLRSGSNQRIIQLKIEINILLDQEIRMWNQHSRLLWLSKGYGNTNFFHSRASHEFKKNLIMGINDSHDHWRENPDDIAGVLLDFYQEHFISSNPTMYT